MRNVPLCTDVSALVLWFGRGPLCLSQRMSLRPLAVHKRHGVDVRDLLDCRLAPWHCAAADLTIGIELMNQAQPNNPLHGLTLEKILTRLVEHYGWSGLYREVRVNCFDNDPSIKSSLKFLRKTQWARDKVEALYINTFS